MKTKEYLFTGKEAYHSGRIDPGDTAGLADKAAGQKKLQENREKIQALQPALYAQQTQALLIVIQAMDAAGKDGTIKHVLSGVNPQGVEVTNFKQPSTAELERDFLWRAHIAVPRRGMIGVFNRSHYEDVLISKVLDLPKDQALPDYARKNLWKNRYRQIRDFEQMLHENGTTVLKFHLHLSRQEQAARFLARLEDPEKRWKFSAGDLDTSGQWDDYMKAYEEAINQTAAPHAPWYVIPADHKWVARALVSGIILSTLRQMKPAFPEPEKTELAEMESQKAALEEIANHKA